ncbi:MAG: hypothetical protein ABIL22_04325 [candidate division WOR-3 bacterium]
MVILFNRLSNYAGVSLSGPLIFCRGYVKFLDDKSFGQNNGKSFDYWFSISNNWLINV